jgi:predicted transcriptional regulator
VTTKVYRGRYTIIAQMLSTINDSGTEGVTKTSIMYKAFLSYAQLKEYLSFMVEKGLIEEVPKQIRNNRGNEKFVYKITGKGLRLLEISNEIESIVGLDSLTNYSSSTSSKYKSSSPWLLTDHSNDRPRFRVPNCNRYSGQYTII